MVAHFLLGTYLFELLLGIPFAFFFVIDIPFVCRNLNMQFPRGLILMKTL